MFYKLVIYEFLCDRHSLASPLWGFSNRNPSTPCVRLYFFNYSFSLFVSQPARVWLCFFAFFFFYSSIQIKRSHTYTYTCTYTRTRDMTDLRLANFGNLQSTYNHYHNIVKKIKKKKTFLKLETCEGKKKLI